MKQQTTFTDFEYGNRRRISKREKFLQKMDKIIPWNEWCQIIQEHYYKGLRGRPPIRIETMLRMYLLQIWFNLSDEGLEDAIYDSYAMRSFMGLDFVSQQVPDATTLLRFRHFLENNDLGKALFNDLTTRLDNAGLMMHHGTIVDATIVEAPSSTKNKDKKRDPEMHQTKKGNQWHFGMKVHIGVDAGTGYVHTITGTAANAADITETHHLVREDDEVVYADAGYQGVQKRPEIKADAQLSKVDYRVMKRPGRKKAQPHYDGINWEKKIEHERSSIRCHVEHAFHFVKNIFGYRKVVYRGIRKNMNRFYMLFASANLLMCIQANRTGELIRGKCA